MKRIIALSVLVWMLLCASGAYASFVSGSTGADGPFDPTVNTEVVLPPDGILNYTTINIPAGVTVTFRKNSKNTPVYMLATGDVTVAGIININGGDNSSSEPGRGGPGGFDGGYAGATGLSGGKGLGPGGGNPSTSFGGGGGFGTVGGSYAAGIGGPAYGNERLLPLIGGSGGGGGIFAANGGGGGGAIVIASSTSINLTGSITANGGGATGIDWAGGGSGEP